MLSFRSFIVNSRVIFKGYNGSKNSVKLERVNSKLLKYIKNNVMESDHHQLPCIYQALYIIHDDVYGDW